MEYICSIGAGKSVQGINGKPRIVHDERFIEEIIRIMGFLSRDLTYIIRAEFRNIERYMGYFKQPSKKSLNLANLVDIAGYYSEFYKYLPLNPISCSRVMTSAPPRSVSV